MVLEDIKWEKEFLKEIKDNGMYWSETDIKLYVNLYKEYKKEYKKEESDKSFLIWLRTDRSSK